MEKQISAVEWFYDKIKSHFEHDGDLLETLIFTYSIAKQKEKEQHRATFNAGFVTIKWDKENEDVFKQYYDETFKSE